MKRTKTRTISLFRAPASRRKSTCRATGRTFTWRHYTRHGRFYRLRIARRHLANAVVHVYDSELRQRSPHTRRFACGANNRRECHRFHRYRPAVKFDGGRRRFLTFTVEFDPRSRLGLRTATIGIANGDSDENLDEFAIQGTGFLREMTFTWDGGGADALWSTAENWVGDLTPLPGSDLVFPADAKQSENINDFYSLGIQIDSITVSGGNYSIQNSTIVSTTVEVRQGAALTASSIVCDTLIIGSAPEAAAANATNDAAARTAEVLDIRLLAISRFQMSPLDPKSAYRR